MKKKKPSLAEIVSRNIRKARLEAGMTQKELADKAGFKVSYVARLETKPQNLSLGVLERIGNSINSDPITFLRDSINNSSLKPSDHYLKKIRELLNSLEKAFLTQ